MSHALEFCCAYLQGLCPERPWVVSMHRSVGTALVWQAGGAPLRAP